MKRLLAVLTAPLLGGAFLTVAATPAQAACVAETSFASVNNAVPATIDGNIALHTSYYDCGTYVTVRSYKWDQYSGPAVRGYYDANLRYYSGGTLRFIRVGLSVPENAWVNVTDFRCNDPCTMVHQTGSRSDVISWPDGTLATGSDAIN